jgi:hypothetical protein
MKGIVFVELLAMADTTFGEHVVDQVISEADLPSGGAYTTVGTYPCEELLRLIDGFSVHSGLTGQELQRRFGHWMLQIFSRHYPSYFQGKTHSLDMLATIEDEIHVEVRKLYPGADLPTFDIDRLAPDRLEMTYRSPRPLADFCQGLIEACGTHFENELRIERRDLKQGVQTETAFSIKAGSAG